MNNEQKCEHPATGVGNCPVCNPANPYLTVEEFERLLSDADRTTEFDKLYLPDLGDIPGICKLGRETWEEYDRLATANETPGFPQMPRMQVVGRHHIVRKPFHHIWREVVGPAYDKAVSLGYRGNYNKWCQFIKEFCPPREPGSGRNWRRD